MLDTGAVDVIFPKAVARLLGINLSSDTLTLKWRGQPFALQFGEVALELHQGGTTWRWKVRVGFSDAPLGYALLGDRGCLQYLDATFFGERRTVKLETNDSIPDDVET